jgi:probable HAF family extracellular repeat protein
MKKDLTGVCALVTLFVALVIPAQLAAQEQSATPENRKHHHRYKLVDLGTFGGPQSYLNDGNGGNNSTTVLNNRGAIAGWADTPTPDPFPAFCFDEDCFVSHAFQRHAGVLTDLGALADGMSSQANWISASGLVAGVSENGEIDPLIPGWPELRAVLWREDGITDLGTLPSGGYESFATAVNSRGQVVGEALNTVPDDFSMVAPGFFTTQTRAFLWQNGTMQDLGTLGTGTDAMAQFINERGQVVGWSYTSSAPNTSCPFFGPLALGSFIWDEKNGMRDLGNLGGTCAIATGVNNRGIVIGDNVDDNTIERGFLWRNGIIQDLGASLGGDFTGSEGINDRGAVAGWAYLAGNASYHAALWQQVGKITDLGVVAGDDCSFASSINAKTQIVGASLPSCAFDNNTRAFLWQNGSILDLNTLIPPGASLHLQWALDINDLGEIAGIGLDVDNNSHAFLLIPCRGDDPSDCQEEIVTAGGSQPGVVPLTRHPQAGNPPNSVRRMLRPRLGLAPHLLKPRSGLAGGRIGATAGTASEAGSMQTLSIPAGEGKLSDYLPGEDMLPNLVRGLCSVDPGTKKLTGGCVGSQGSHCVSKRDSAHCPAGQPAKRAEWLQLCVYLQGYVDGARTCTAL